MWTVSGPYCSSWLYQPEVIGKILDTNRKRYYGTRTYRKRISGRGGGEKKMFSVLEIRLAREGETRAYGLRRPCTACRDPRTRRETRFINPVPPIDWSIHIIHILTELPGFVREQFWTKLQWRLTSTFIGETDNLI